MGENSYAIKDDTLFTQQEVKDSYYFGYEDGLAEAEEASMASHIEIIESWMSNFESVTINGDVVHIIDGNGEEWVITGE